MGTHQFGGNGQTQPGAAGPRGALKGLEQMGPRPFRDPWTGVGHLDDDHAALTAARDTDLVAGRIARPTRVRCRNSAKSAKVTIAMTRTTARSTEIGTPKICSGGTSQ